MSEKMVGWMGEWTGGWTDGQVAGDIDGRWECGLTWERKDRRKETAVDRQDVVLPTRPV